MASPRGADKTSVDSLSLTRIQKETHRSNLTTKPTQQQTYAVQRKSKYNTAKTGVGSKRGEKYKGKKWVAGHCESKPSIEWNIKDLFYFFFLRGFIPSAQLQYIKKEKRKE